MKSVSLVLITVILALLAPDAYGQAVLKGKLYAPQHSGSSETVPVTAVHCFANAAGPNAQAIAFRTWETHPVGWYFLPGPAGNYSIVFSAPGGFMRPLVLTNQFVENGGVVDRIVSPVFDYADFIQTSWDEKPAADYYQTFTAKGTSITQVGFKLATDGVDGGGPAGQNILISIHKKKADTPNKWPQVGPTAIVLNVDCGGAKNYWWSTGWDSGQVPTQPGQTYAVHLRAESQGGSFQAFWRRTGDGQNDCYRVGKDGKKGWRGTNLCMTVASDSDGLVIPYNKRVHKEYVEFAGFDRSWSQTYIAKGRSLASVIIYAATSGAQPSMNRQRLKVRLRKGGPDGAVVGIEKIAIGNGNYTGDASWGMFGVSFAPGEVPLVPGERYAVEFESIENYNTLHGYVNIKGQVSDDRVGFNPYRKISPDTYNFGTAYRKCVDAQDFDLDVQIVEYQHNARDWHGAVETGNLIANGRMEQGGDKPGDWRTFAVVPDTGLCRTAEGKDKTNHVARVYGGSSTGKAADGGFVQEVIGLSKLETYRLSGRVRSTWPVDEKHSCMIGFDPTGQDTDPDAGTIQWTILPAVSGLFVDYQSRPIRPADKSVSVWLRGKTTLTVDYRFEADFDEFALRKVDTGVPSKGGK